MRITVDCSKQIAPLDHFWQSTGFSPGSLLLNADMRQAMTYVGSIPHGGITHVRAHYLLDLVRAKSMESDQPWYDWSALDAALDVLVQNGLKPFFELMGNPSGYFGNFLSETQLHAWRRLVRDLALHTIERYTREEVRSWYFETWNEPDFGWWRQGARALCNCHDASAEGLAQADERLRLGGPGTALGLSSTFKAFLAHCDRGTNYLTGERGVRLDFVSVHEKGAWAFLWDLLSPNTKRIVDHETRIVDYIRAHHPSLAQLPFMNNECDPQLGWWHNHDWRTTPYYAALVSKIVNQRLLELIDRQGYPYALLSNDNGFLGGWGQRTLLARFGDMADVRGQFRHHTHSIDLHEDRTRRRFELIKKPVYSAMVMLSLLGDARCAVDGRGDPYADVGAIASRRGDGQVAVLVYHSRDRVRASGVREIELQLEGLPFARPMLAHYRIDGEHTNPYAQWQEMGRPDLPLPAGYARLRDRQELALLEAPREVEAAGGTLTLRFALPLPGVSLILLTARPGGHPGKVEGLRAERYEGLTGKEEVMLAWQDVGSRAIRTYEVLYAPSPDGPFERVNDADLLCTAFLHVREPTDHEGYYGLRAVDYWGRRGEMSEIVVV
jgi:L-iduronidase